MGFDADALRRLGGDPPPRSKPVTATYLLRVGLAAAVGAALSNLVVLMVANNRAWSVAAEGLEPVRALSVVLVCALVGLLAALATYVAARVTKRPAMWVVVAGVGILLASVQGLPLTLRVMHAITGAWVIAWLGMAVRGGTHLRDD